MSNVRRACLILIAVIACAQSRAQSVAESDDSRHSPPALTSAVEQTLFVLGKTWGYLKYHDPKVTGGCFDWDAELLSALPAIAEVVDAEGGNTRINNWISETVDAAWWCTDDTTGEKHFGTSNDWLADSAVLGEALSERLRFEPDYGGTRAPQKYVTLAPFVGNPRFDSEDSYEDLENPDWRYRLLALYRFWNVIEYWFPYRNLISEEWDDVLREFIPRMIAAESPGDYVLELMALAARAEDGHTNLWSAINERPPAGTLNVPVQLRMVEGRPVVWKVFGNGSGPGALQVGDVILEVGGEPVGELVESWLPYYGASNRATNDRQVATDMLRGKTGEVAVTIERDGRERALTLERESQAAGRMTHDRDGDTLQLLSDDIAYLKLSSIEADKTAEYIEAVMGYQGLIIDIRNYPSAFVVFALGQHLVDEKTEFARFTNGDLTKPGTFRFTEPIELEPAAPFFGGKVAILVDEMTLSQSEYTTMAFSAGPNAFVVGSQTAGADGNVSSIYLPGGHRAMITGIGVFYPDRTPTQKVGIAIDITVKPTIAGIRAGRDEVLEAAVREILGDGVSEQSLLQMTRLPQAPD